MASIDICTVILLVNFQDAKKIDKQFTKVPLKCLIMAAQFAVLTKEQHSVKRFFSFMVLLVEIHRRLAAQCSDSILPQLSERKWI